MSEQDVRSLIADSQHWFAELARDGWVAAVPAGLTELSDAGTGLFDEAEPPLVVGLFGGTGVGKSSLLNRLAGQDVARTGVVRPTSMEITAFFHERINLAHLPAGFPDDNFVQARHRRDELSNVVWVDMPDFDSDETQNREQVLQWLPHIDLLVYVVTPERYRDAAGWKLLLQEGYGHAWLFVINQWDRADPVQFEDFTALLKSAGFVQPRVFRTICSGEQRVEDDFPRLAELVSGLAQRKIIEQLHNRGWLSRLLESQSRLNTFATSLEYDAGGSAIDLWRERWSGFIDETIDNQRLAARSFARQFEPAAEEALFKRLMARGADDTARAAVLADASKVEDLWDQWARTRLQGIIDRFISEFSTHGLATRPLSKLFTELPARAEQRITSQLRNRLNKTVRNPGPRWRQLSFRLCKYLQVILPVAAVVWAGWRVVSGFVAAGEDPQAYVGFNILANTVMLAGLGWLLPWIASQAVKPVLKQWIEIDLLDQLGDELRLIGAEQESGIEQLVNQRAGLERQLKQFEEQTSAIFERASLLENEELNQLLLPHPSVG